MKKLAILFALTLCVALAGCNQPAPPQGGESTQIPSGTVSTSPTEEATEPAPPADQSTPTEGEQTVTLYIGTKAGGFTEYPMTYEGELTPELLIQGGMSVCLSNESALFTGPPDPQKDEFHVYDAEQLAEMILDSIQKTLQEGFTLEGGDPDALDIWYYMEGEQPLELPALGLFWPIDQPYQWEGAESK